MTKRDEKRHRKKNSEFVQNLESMSRSKIWMPTLRKLKMLLSVMLLIFPIMIHNMLCHRIDNLEAIARMRNLSTEGAQKQLIREYCQIFWQSTLNSSILKFSTVAVLLRIATMGVLGYARHLQTPVFWPLCYTDLLWGEQFKVSLKCRWCLIFTNISTTSYTAWVVVILAHFKEQMLAQLAEMTKSVRGLYRVVMVNLGYRNATNWGFMHYIPEVCFHQIFIPFVLKNLSHIFKNGCFKIGS